MREIRIAGKADYPRMALIETRCFRHPWSEKAIAEYAESGGMILVACENGAVQGHILTTFVLDEGDIGRVATDPDFRRQGVASELFTALEEEAAKRGVKKLFLEVRVSNAGAVALYEKEGFTAVGRRKGFYRDPLEDALLYRKDLV